MADTKFSFDAARQQFVTYQEMLGREYAIREKVQRMDPGASDAIRKSLAVWYEENAKSVVNPIRLAPPPPPPPDWTAWTQTTNITIPAPPTPAIAKPLTKELLAGPLVAHRAWKLRLGSGMLGSTGINATWGHHRPKPAYCQGVTNGSLYHRQEDACPAPGCLCGWYAFKTEADARALDADLLGTVALWGKVIAHTKGYRAQYAWPLTVTYPLPMPGFPVAPTVRKELEAIAGNYGCEVYLGEERVG